MKKKNFNKLPVESKRIKWAGLNKTLVGFVVVMIFLAIFTLLIVLFSWSVDAFLGWIS